MKTDLYESILYLSRKDVTEICQHIDSVDAVREAFKMHASGKTTLPDETYLGWVNAHGEHVRSFNMPSYLGDTLDSAGTKIINGNIQNPARGLPRASGLTLLFDSITGQICCLMDAAYISSLRTASVSVLAVKELQGELIKHIAVIGAGALAQAHIELFLQRFSDLQTIHIFDLDVRRIKTLSAALTSSLQSHNVQLQIAETAEAAIRASQVIIPVTTTTEGYIQFEWLQPGAIVVNVSLDDILPEVVFRADKVIVDDWNLVKNDRRRILGRLYGEGKIKGPEEFDDVSSGEHRRIDAQLGEIILGAKEGRQNVQDIILVNPFGLSIEDIALATHVYRFARQIGVGTYLER